MLLATDHVPDLHFVGAGAATQCLPLYSYTPSGECVDNITDWALDLFNNHYKILITKEEIFHYVYSILHNPVYQNKYKLNLKREFPRIPLNNNFPKWVAWGKQLMYIHTNYEHADPFSLQQLDMVVEAKNLEALEMMAKSKLKAYKKEGRIVIDGFTELLGIPDVVWDYKLGNRSALEWVLEQYKEKKPSDPTILEKFNTYRFADYKEKVIELIKKLCTVSIETMKIISEMEALTENKY
jgi:predicted helicase